MPVRNKDPVQRIEDAEMYTKERKESSLPASYMRTWEAYGLLTHPLQRAGIQLWEATGIYVEENYPVERLFFQNHQLLEVREYGGPLPASAGMLLFKLLNK